MLRGANPAVVTFEEIADAAGVSRALLYNYFGDRQGLMEALERRSLDDLVATIADAVLDAATPREELAASVRAHLDAASRDPAGYRLMASRLVPPGEVSAHARLTLGPCRGRRRGAPREHGSARVGAGHGAGVGGGGDRRARRHRGDHHVVRRRGLGGPQPIVVVTAGREGWS